MWSCVPVTLTLTSLASFFKMLLPKSLAIGMQNDWFDDQDEEIQRLLQDKNLDRHVLGRCIRELKNIWFWHRHGRSTVDGIFGLRQLMKKTREQHRCLHIALVDFVKSFDTGNGELLFIILWKLGCPSKFIRIINKLYTDVHARLAIDGKFTQSFKYNSGLRQECKLGQTLFGPYAAVLLWPAFKKVKHTYSVQTRLHNDSIK